MNLQEVRATAESIARRAGEAIMPYWSQPLTETTKANIFDIVTEGDKASEAAIIAGLREAFPDHQIVSEEGGGTSSNDTGRYFWYIDPIDGTTNFAHKLPYFSVSIALADRSRSPLVGVVFNPVSGELYSAAKGYGATLNDSPIHVTATQALDRSLLATGFPTDKQRALQNVAYWQALLLRCRDLRRFGSAALDICAVAAGRLEGFWENGINTWDVLAGILITREAGGTATDLSGGETRLYSGDEVILSNSAIHAELLEILNTRF